MNLSWIEITGLVALGLVELGLLAAAWIVLFRTPAERLTMPKWAWALLCLIQFVGPIVFFVAGRKPAPMADTSVSEPTATPDTVIDGLYGRDR
jgi:protein-S-isoprenylcysteine O-methyltransferase Ste14